MMGVFDTLLRRRSFLFSGVTRSSGSDSADQAEVLILESECRL